MRVASSSSIAIFLSISLFAGIGGVLVGQEGAIAAPIAQAQVNEGDRILNEIL